MKRTPLRRRSAKVTAVFKIYRPEVARRVKEAKGTCDRCRANCGKLDPHHYAGTRAGLNLLRFVIIGRRCHDDIHARPNAARACGWLPQMDGTFIFPRPVAIIRAEARFAEMDLLSLQSPVV